MTDAAAAAGVDPGSTAWMLVSSAMVLLMVPGLALFYGGLVRRKNVLSTMLHSFAAMGVIGVQWILIGYALSFGASVGGWIGWDPSLVGLSGLPYTRNFADKAIPELVFVMFQGKFAIITPALISGAIAERMKFSAFIWFVLLWTTFVYCPLAHWVWSSGGWLYQFGVLDFAGGTVVHISSGFSALMLALVLGPRRDYRPGRSAILPHNLALTMLGAGLLWFGWFGFNAGSAVAADHPVAGHIAGLAFATTQSAAAAGGLTWLLIEWWRQRRPTSLGIVSGILAGLVAITPAAGHVTPLAAPAFGAISAVVCYAAVQAKPRFEYDDSLDAFGVHGVGGLIGALLTGVFCFIPVAGLAAGGGFAQVGKQAAGAAVAITFALAGTFVIARILGATVGLRTSDEEERDGLDVTVHGERAYHHVVST